METDSYSANQRRAINLVWTACGDYQFEPQFLALKADGTPDFYMNCVIGLVRKWLGDEMPRRLFALWADDTRRSAFDDLTWLALENAVYEKELPVRPVLTELRRAHAAEFFASEYPGKICPYCGSEHTYLVQGNEHQIKEIEVSEE